MKTITLKVPSELDERLAYESRRRQVSRSVLVREALAAYLSDKPLNGDKPSVYDLIKDLVGTVDGPGDLSTNPKHLEDLGQDSMGRRR